MALAKNTPVTFRFRSHPLLGSVEKSGEAIVVDETIVGTDRAYILKVTGGDSYSAGEFIDVRARGVRPL